MDEISPESQFNKMMEQMKSQQNIPGVNPKSPPVEHQRILNEVQTSRPPQPIAPSQGDCPQCGMLHPPLAPGEKCPIAPVKIDGVQDIDITQFVVKIKDILTSQLEQKGVKDYKKFSSGMIMELVKYCEGYKE
jgi:hypothetical protein